MAPRPSKGGSDPRKWPVRNVSSYGGVVVDVRGVEPHVALIRPHSDDDKVVWALPKGAKEDGEDGPAAALREVREETGLEAEVIEEIEPIIYWFVWASDQLRYRKTVHFYLMRLTGGEPTPDHVEVAEVCFVPLTDAPKQATYPSERKVLKRAGELVAAW